MTPIRTHTRPRGLERGTAVLAFVTCSTFAFGIAALTQSVLTGLIAALGLLAALVLTLGSLPGEISR